MSKQTNLPEDLYWMLRTVDEELDDKSTEYWWAVLENYVSWWNQQHNTKLDENETVHLFIQRCQEEHEAGQ